MRQFPRFELTPQGCLEFRILAGLTKPELAKRMNLGKRGYRTISEWEKGNRKISPSHATLLGIICYAQAGIFDGTAATSPEAMQRRLRENAKRLIRLRGRKSKDDPANDSDLLDNRF